MVSSVSPETILLRRSLHSLKRRDGNMSVSLMESELIHDLEQYFYHLDGSIAQSPTEHITIKFKITETAEANPNQTDWVSQLEDEKIDQ